MHLGHTVFLLAMIVVNMLKCNVFFFGLTCFCIMPPIQGELSPAAWQCYSLVNLTQEIQVISLFLSYKTTNVSAILAFSSVD